MIKRKKRNVKIIFPSTITTFAMVFGFVAILKAMNDEIITASYLIMLALLMDGLDGKVARFTNTASEFGIQYDSMSDVIAFGVAPCVVYARFFLHEQITDKIYYLLPIMFMVCGAIRLARFNVTASIYGKTHFTGLPIPAAAYMVVSLPIFLDWSSRYPLFQEMGLDVYLTKTNMFQISIVLVVALSLSMISALKFDTPGGFWLRKFKYKPFNYMVLGAFLSLILVHYALFAVGISLYYLTSMYGRTLYERIRKHEMGPDHEMGPETVEPVEEG